MERSLKQRPVSHWTIAGFWLQINIVPFVKGRQRDECNGLFEQNRFGSSWKGTHLQSSIRVDAHASSILGLHGISLGLAHCSHVANAHSLVRARNDLLQVDRVANGCILVARHAAAKAILGFLVKEARLNAGTSAQLLHHNLTKRRDGHASCTSSQAGT